MTSNSNSTRKRSLAPKLRKLLDAGIGERDGLAPFVKQYPKVLKSALLGNEGGWVRGIAEFKFGNELQADFVLLTAFSGGFMVKFIELESSTDRILTKKGLLAARFNQALSQIHRWQEYVGHRIKAGDLGLELERQFREKEILEPEERGTNPSDNTTLYPLSHPDCALGFSYAIVIGRRSSLTSQEIARKASLRSCNLEIVSWDRLLEAADEISLSGERLPPRPRKPFTMAEFKRIVERRRRILNKASSKAVGATKAKPR